MAWISKKSKQQMRNRRRKTEVSNKRKREEGSAGGEDETDSSKNWEVVQKEETVHKVEIPSTLSTKDARKMRKEARRVARKEGRDESKIKFVDENGLTLTIKADSKKDDTDEKDGEAAEITPVVKKRKARSYPSINQLLAEADAAKQLQKEQDKRDAYDNSISDEVKSSYVALDCEMVGIGTDGKESALARVSITDWNEEILLDTFVQVPDRVTDFRTHVSGVRAKDIRSTNEKAMELHACRKTVGVILKSKILVGHSLKNDFAALMLDHPKSQIRDTAKYKPFMRASGRNGGKLRPRKLRDLVKEHLGLTIQKEGEAHTSVEDAQATLKLYKSARETWEKELEKKAASGKGFKR
jgi:RNA exonuclease 4